MNSTFRFLSFVLLALVSAKIAVATEPAEVLARKAISENTAASSTAIEELRSLGPAGLKALMTQYAGAINVHIKNPSAAPDEEWQRISAALCDNSRPTRQNRRSWARWANDCATISVRA